jgi:hypothetical protein
MVNARGDVHLGGDRTVRDTPARADIMWTLSGVTFAGGEGAASGTFTTDASGNLTSADITTTSSLPRFPGNQYDTTTGTLEHYRVEWNRWGFRHGATV